jgi:hypothetical protein
VATQIHGKGGGDGTLSGPIGVVNKKCDGDSIVLRNAGVRPHNYDNLHRPADYITVYTIISVRT